MLSDCILDVLSSKEKIGINKDICDSYEKEIALFDDLIKSGMATRRGYQLMPAANTFTNNIEVNHCTKRPRSKRHI